MAEHKIELGVELKTDLAKSKSLISDIDKQGGFAGKTGGAAKAKVEGYISSLEKMAQADKLTTAEFVEFKKRLSEVNDVLVKYASKISQLTEKATKLQEELKLKQEARSKQAETVKEKKSTQADKEAALVQAMKGREFHKVNKDGTLAGGKPLTAETLAKLLSDPETAKTVGYKNLSTGKEVTNGKMPQDIAKAATEYNNAIKEVDAAKTALTQLTETVRQAEAAFRTQVTKDEKAGLSGNPELTETALQNQSTTDRDLEKKDQEISDTTNAEKIKEATVATEQYNASLNKQSSALGKAFKQFSIYAIGVRTVRRALRSAIKTIQDLDKYLTEQAMVTGKTRKETYALLKTYQDLAKTTGATTKEVAEVATQFMRQGKSTRDALTLTEAAIKAAKVAGISATESVNYLTTALNGFQLAAKDAMKVSDKFAAVAASSATSYEELATALSKVASQANMAGMSIDYTTALLAKGIETTREAPETIGTALKTVIARMRELTDYGETLEGDTDVNNVETQLGYIGIALRNTNGELRSTEDVLNDLGKKWDTLNSNQQAAVAKALAGTRQQSRLIAMMSDYERTIELQEISLRSSGATAAQAATYLEGMEAATNKVKIAWEQIVTTITDSEAIINIIEGISNFLDGINGALNNEFILVSSMVLIIGAIVLSLTKKWEIQKLNNRAILDEKKTKIDNQLLEKSAYLAGLRILRNRKKAYTTEKEITKLKASQALLDNDKTNDAIAQAALLEASKLENSDIATIDAEIAKTEGEIANLRIQQVETTIQTAQNAGGILSIFGNLLSVLTPILSIMTLINMVQMAIVKNKAKEVALEKKGLLAKLKVIPALLASAYGKCVSDLGPIAGSIAFAAIAASIVALGVIGGIAIAKGINSTKKSDSEAASENINKLSGEIYKLTTKANAIQTITDQYDALDKKIIQTIEDQEKMNELLDSAGDKLSSERSTDNKGNEIKDSEQDIYNKLQSNQAKRIYLEQREIEARAQANVKRQEQLNILKNLSEEERKDILNSKDQAQFLESQDAIFAINNNTLYEYIDSLKSVKDGTESFTQAILENLTAEEAYKYAIEDNCQSIKNLVDAVDKGSLVIDNQSIGLGEILTSDDYSFKDKIKAYEQLSDSIKALGDDTLTKAFKDTYGQWEKLKILFSDNIDFIDSMDITIDELNAMSAALVKLGYSADQSAAKLSSMFDRLESGANLEQTIKIVFADILNQFDYLSTEWITAYNTILNAYSNAVGTGILNTGQNLTKLKNQINSFYETASKWSSMNDQEKTEFISNNAALFEGEQGAELYKAFESGDYNRIQLALAENDALKETIALRLKELETDLEIEKARRLTGDANEAYIVELEKQIKALEDYEDVTSSIYQASLDLRLEQEKAQLDIYKEYLQKQQEALQESLNDRKEAYQKYFDAINQEAEDEDYEEQANLLMTNLQKLSSSTDANSKQQSKELEKQLKDLEDERLKTLRERAQEAVLKNLDDEVSQINEKFDKLLENNQALLNAMLTDAEDADKFVASTLASNLKNKSALEAEQYIQEFKTTYDSLLPESSLSDISVRGEGDNLILNINGQEIQIGEATQQDLYSIIMNALKQQGLR